jgi:hypothetical protein
MAQCQEAAADLQRTTKVYIVTNAYANAGNLDKRNACHVDFTIILRFSL